MPLALWPAPLDARLACTRACGSLDGNKIGPEGGKALAAVLPQTKLKELKCAPAPEPTARPPTPLDARLACAEPPHPSSDRLFGNDLDEDAPQALRAAAGERIKLGL